MIKKKMIRLFSLMIAMSVIMSMFSSLCASALSFVPKYYDDMGKLQEIDIYSQSVYMINMESGEVIYELNSEAERAPASLTMIMTAIVMLDKVGSDTTMLKQTYVSAGTEAFDELFDTGAATADIQPYEQVSYYDLLAAMLIPSACEAANIIAINVAGDIPSFVDMMNSKAQELGLEHTHFSNTHGLFTQQNYSSAKDISVMCRYALDNYPVFKEIVAMSNYFMEPTDFHNPGSVLQTTNQMINGYSPYYYSSCKGIRTGSTESAGRCLATYAMYDTQSYMIVSLGAPIEKREEDYEKGADDEFSIFAQDIVYYNMLDHIHLYNWAFNMLEQTNFINKDSEIRDVKVEYGRKLDYANLKPAEGYSQMWPVDLKTDDVERIITVKENIVAPIEKGDVLGSMELKYQGETLAVIDLISTTQVERSPVKERIKIIRSYFRSPNFKITLIIIIAGFSIYALTYFIMAQKKYLRKK